MMIVLSDVEILYVRSCFRFDTVGDILRALEKEGSRFSLQTIDQICDGSPLAVALTLEQIRRASELSLAQCLRMEFNSWQISPVCRYNY